MVKEAVEDWRRKTQDIEANNLSVLVYGKDNQFHKTKWKKLRVGDLVKVHKDAYFPADLFLISSSYDDGVCYVETMNLDGETNLKLKQSLEVTSSLHDEKSFQKFRAVIKCEDPNENLYSFIGTLSYDGAELPLSIQQLLLRDSKLKNTEFIHGIVVFTGHDTKVMQNATDPPSKRSKIERKMDKIVYILFSTLVLISFIGSIYFFIVTKRDMSGLKLRRWYLRPDHSTVLYDPRRAFLAAVLHFLTGLMLYGYLIPISLYVSIEIVKVLQSIFINQDRDMYHEETKRRARARTSNLNEELGQIDTILSDKTGTLTCNSMEFVKCSIAGTAYGRGMAEVEIALARQRGDEPPGAREVSSDSVGHKDHTIDSKKLTKGFNFIDERIMLGKWVNEPYSDIIEKFFLVLAICHTAIPDVNKISGEISYEAQSPDEAAFVIAARELGFQFFERKQTSISLHVFDPRGSKKVDRTYELLHVLEFSSARKRMSVIVRNEENQLSLLSKGADSVMFERLSRDGRAFEAETRDHIKTYSEAGLRTLVVAYRELGEEEYNAWQEEFTKDKTSVTAERDELADAAADKIEKDLILLGATAVEDKLQEGVPECIDKLAQAGVKIWVLTGDKMETAINIGYACSLLRQGMKQIIISLDSPDISALQKEGNKEAIAKGSHKSIADQIEEGKSQVNSAKESSDSFGLIIDGHSLSFALDKSLDKSFLELAIKCDSVICCRSSPKQKALVTQLVKGTGKTTLSVGDGANDVGMLQEADIGVGISGAEGMQICYFFYKNIAFRFTLFWFEAYASFSGQAAYNDWYMSFYNVFFTSLPAIALGVFDQDVSALLCLKYPLLYQGVQNILFSWHRIIGWMLNGVINSLIIFFFATNAIIKQAFRRDWQVVDLEILGALVYTCVVWTVNVQMALSINYFTWIQHFFIWGSIAFWYIFLVIYGSLTPSLSTTAYMIFVEACAPSPLYWLATLFVVVSSLLPYFCYRAFQTRFRPLYHDIIQIRRSEGSEIEASDELPDNVKYTMQNLKGSVSYAEERVMRHSSYAKSK